MSARDVIERTIEQHGRSDEMPGPGDPFGYGCNCGHKRSSLTGLGTYRAHVAAMVEMEPNERGRLQGEAGHLPSLRFVTRADGLAARYASRPAELRHVRGRPVPSVPRMHGLCASVGGLQGGLSDLGLVEVRRTPVSRGSVAVNQSGRRSSEEH